MQDTDPLPRFLSEQGVLILDGGLATELEAKGCDLTDELWSARLLIDRPDLIRRVHREYLEAGADCVISASYQATFEGLMGRGLSPSESAGLLLRAVDLARQARDEFWAIPAQRDGRIRPLVAASVGPFGAYLADGSEFSGAYGLTELELYRFHRRRFRILADSKADLLACETIPSWTEARALRRLVEEAGRIRAWFSFSCRSGRELCDGTPIETAIAGLEAADAIVAVGFNCTAPAFMAELIERARSVTAKPIVVYPNSGEVWDARARRWRPGDPVSPSLTRSAQAWFTAGARLIGGCCRTTPADIRQVRSRLLA